MFQNLSASEDEAILAQAAFDLHHIDTLKMELQEAQLKLAKRLLQEEIFGKKKSRIKWLQEGDSNTRFFHSQAQTRMRERKSLNIEDEHGNLTSDINSVHRIALSYFKKNMTSQGTVHNPTLMSVIPSMISNMYPEHHVGG